MIGIIDYGSGNFTSVYNAVQLITSDCVAITDKSDFAKCSHVILPGVGSFANAMKKISDMGIVETLRESVLVKKIPFLGICVGMQILADKGYEFGEHEGLGYIKGVVKKIAIDQDIYPLPHMGWNEVLHIEHSPLFKGIDKDATFYFVHSYCLELESQSKLKTVNTFYGTEFPAAISIENIHAVQFHPEKSQVYGLQLLRNFVTL
jgi:glutamine amidotransferase